MFPWRPVMMLPVIAAWCSLAVAGRWIVPDWPAGQEPKFEPVHLYWFEVRECPLIYRTEVEVPKEADRATALLRTSGYVYVCVDGRQVYAWAPRERTKDQPAVPADPNRVHELDFTPCLTPGRHVLTVSAPAKGFVLHGGHYAGTKRLAPLATNGKWTVTKFPPTTLVEDHPIMSVGYTGPAALVKEVAREAPGELGEGKQWIASEDDLAKAYYRAFVERCQKDLDGAFWRLELLTKKGIYIADGAACGWGGPGRVEETTLKQLAGIFGARAAIAERVGKLAERKGGGLAAVEQALPEMAETRGVVDELLAEATKVAAWQSDRDEHTALTLATGVVEPTLGEEARLRMGMATWRRRLEERLGHPLSRLNESRYDRLGWINHPELTDSDIGKWGVRINPVTGPTKVAAPRQWLFSIDPKDEGLKELRWSIGYNVEGQWPRVNPTQSWTRDPRFADYKGVAWYRTRIQIPSEWAGNEVHLAFSIAGKERLWLNDMEITRLGAGEGKRTYKIPANYIAPGAENSLAIRVEADGPQRGLVGPLEASCPALEGPEAKATPPVAILATPLSPCVVLTPETDTIEIRHGGKGRLQLPGSGVPLIELERYEPAKPGRLPAGNWALVRLSPATRTSPQRPILLVFEQDPLSLVCEEGVTRVKLPRPGVRVVAVRPWARLEPGSGKKPVDILVEARFWSQAALAVPVNYMSVTRVLRPGEPIDNISVSHVPRGPVLGHTVIYDYLETKDQWGTKPLTIAPLPALCSFALDSRFRTLKLDQQVEVLQDGGLLAPYRGIVGADRVGYSYEVEPYPRFAGFTSWMFSGVDTGVLGNKRELELIAATGANSYRPQHNFSDEPPPQGLDPGGGRTRVQCIADYCQALGLNYMNNIDQTLGCKQEFVRNNYPEFMELVTVHLEKIARQLHARPFWAVAYDLINEPFDHKHERYNPAMKELTRRVRAIDKTHLCYVEPCEAWGAIQQLQLIEPTGDPLTVYSFHDYNFRLYKAEDRWPTLDRDITSIYRMWLPAIEFQIKHAACMHCGEFGGYHHPTDDSVAQTLLMNDFFRIFDQFGMHHHYYTGRDVYQRLADGSIRPSNVIHAYRAYFRRPDFNLYHRRWPGHPELPRTP